MLDNITLPFLCKYIGPDRPISVPGSYPLKMHHVWRIILKTNAPIILTKQHKYNSNYFYYIPFELLQDYRVSLNAIDKWKSDKVYLYWHVPEVDTKQLALFP